MYMYTFKHICTYVYIYLHTFIEYMYTYTDEAIHSMFKIFKKHTYRCICTHLRINVHIYVHMHTFMIYIYLIIYETFSLYPRIVLHKFNTKKNL